MPTITFLPDHIATNVLAGTALLDAATAAGVTISAPCGGEGACGACRVRVISGTVERLARGCLTPEELGEGWALACSSRVLGDATVSIPATDETQSETTAPNRIVTTAENGADRIKRSPLASKLCLTVEAPSLENSFSDFERVERSVAAGGGPAPLRAGLGALQEMAGALRAQERTVTLTLLADEAGSGAALLRIEPGDTTGQALGVAIDIGTTTCAAHLVDLAHGRILGTAAELNGQIGRGLDIISRIHYARTPERLEELRRRVVDTLNELVDRLCGGARMAADDIMNAAVAGNTTMIHLLLGLDPDPIRLAPYTPTVNRPPLLTAREVGLHLHPEACIQIAPGVGSYVGGDITAGLLQTALTTDSEEIRLFLDIGTNGEVVCGNHEWLMACAASAGPAFEGAGVSCGMRAGQGAIERVRVDPATGCAAVTVIGGGAPRGVCGSGMIDLLAELWQAGLLDPSGKLIADHGPGVIAPAANASGRNLAYTIVPAAQSGTGEAIVIDEHDIMNLLRTKAAIYSACSLMLRQVGLGFDDIAQVYVAGGFGRYLDLARAIQIGMLPDLPLERYTYLGNSALGGALAMLTDPAARRTVTHLADRMTYLELNTDPAYMDEYLAALFLPHTDAGRFPSVARS